jgi:hypothetical protein
MPAWTRDHRALRAGAVVGEEGPVKCYIARELAVVCDLDNGAVGNLVHAIGPD